MDISANWIWLDEGRGEYNQMVVFRRDLRLESLPTTAGLAVTADSVYRLKVNGQWLGDGPSRGYPNHYNYDLYDLSGILRPGLNRIEAEVRYFGIGTFHQLPQRGGFLAQLEVDGQRIVTDGEWLAARMPQWYCDVPKSSVQQSPMELYDASSDRWEEWRKATVIADPPWSGLREREIPQLTRCERLFERVVSVNWLEAEPTTLSFQADAYFFPATNDLSNNSTRTYLIALVLDSPREQQLMLASTNAVIRVNGKAADEEGRYLFNAGENFIVFAPVNCGSGGTAFVEISLPAVSGIGRDALRYSRIATFPELMKQESNLLFGWANAPLLERKKTYCALRDGVMEKNSGSMAEFMQRFPEAEELPLHRLWPNTYQSFLQREPSPVPPGMVKDPQYPRYPDQRPAVLAVPPEGKGVEFCFDFGVENIGYWNFVVDAPAGTVIDISAVEYIDEEGNVQYPTAYYRNTMRYICREGINRFTSYRRRAGRYLFMSFRNFGRPVKFHSLRVVESTYPVLAGGSFRSSNPVLDKIYINSGRTLQLCMEDTFTDCPLFEQSFWVGDARSEGLFAMSYCGAYDLVRRCIRLAGESLERLPLVGCVLPAGKDCLIPIWSFMWVLSVEDYYRETGDGEFARVMMPQIRQCLDNAIGMIDRGSGLFRAGMWNLFDWSPTNCNKELMLQNSFFLIGAIDSCCRLSEELQCGGDLAGYRSTAAGLKEALNRLWDTRRQTYPDAIEADGSQSTDVSVHTSMLAELFDAGDEKLRSSIRTNILTRHHDLIPITSPFASFYYYQTLEKLEHVDDIIEAILRDYTIMAETGPGTVWETYNSSGLAECYGAGNFLTRSYCHAWSSSPLYFLPRIALGIIPVGVGGREFIISPRVGLLEYAEGSRTTIHGDVCVKWRKVGKELIIRAEAPAGVKIRFEANPSTDLFNVDFTAVERQGI